MEQQELLKNLVQVADNDISFLKELKTYVYGLTVDLSVEERQKIQNCFLRIGSKIIF